MSNQVSGVVRAANQLQKEGTPAPTPAPKPPSLEDFGDMWNAPKPTPGAPASAPVPAPSAPPQQDYFAQQKYFDGMDFHKIAESFRNGDVDGISKAFTDMARSLHKFATRDALQLAQHYSDAAKNDAINQSTNNSRSSMAYESLYEAAPAFRDPAINPMARAAFDQQIRKGATVQEAIDKTKTFFKVMSGAIGDAFRQQEQPNGEPGNRGNPAFVPSGGVSRDAKGQEINWDEMFNA